MEKRHMRKLSILMIFALFIQMLSGIAPTLVTAQTNVKSPIIGSEGKVTFNYVDSGETAMYVIGNFNEWNLDTAVEMKKENGIFTATIGPLNAGEYEYKFLRNNRSWDDSVKDPLNDQSAGDNSAFTVGVVEKAESPLVKENGEVTFRYIGEADRVRVAGSFTSWQDNALEMEKNDEGVWQLTVQLTPGTYEYKFILGENNWITDPGNNNKAGDNSVVHLPGIIIESANDMNVGMEIELNAKWINEAGEKSEVKPVWSLKESKAGVALQGNRLSVANDYKVKENDSVTVVATYNNKSVEKQINILSSLYTYNIHYYRHDGEQNNWDMWIWWDGKNGEAYSFTEEVGEYAKATYKFPTNKISVITRPGNWDTQEEARVIEIKDGNTVDVWLVQNDSQVYYSEPQLNEEEMEQRYVRVRYVRPDKDFTDWNIWVWNTGVKDNQIDFEKIEGDTAIANIAIGPKTDSIGFLIRKGTDWETAKISPESDDHNVTIDPEEVITKVTVVTGVPGQTVVPVVKGPVLNDGNVTFFYRDEALYRNDLMDTIESVKVKVLGKEYDMVYDRENEYFTYTMEGISEGIFEYSFLVTKDGKTEEVLDPKNTVDGKSVVEYRVPEINIAARVKPEKVTYNENAIISLNIENPEKALIKEIYADLTPVGGNDKVKIDPQLNAVTFGVKDTVLAGMKEITVTVVDEYGNNHQQKAQVEVVARLSQGKLDFDWDEARIYFMLTDRFHDGDKTNNHPYGYDPTHPEAYHGGDFQGIINKLDYLEDLGINTIWISPIVDNIDFNKGADFTTAEGLAAKQYAYHGYWAKDFTSLDPTLGDMDKFKELIEKAHDRGMKIMVDVVLNHAGYGMSEYQNDWQDLPGAPTDDEKKTFEGMIREKSEGGEIRAELDGLPDFKTEDPEVRNQLIDWQTAWLEKARTDRGDTIDYFRVDTVKHVEDTTWMAFKNALTEIAPSFKMIGEYWGASYNLDGGHLRSGQMDSLLDFDFKEKAKSFVNGDMEAVEAYLQERNAKIDNTAMLGQFLSSHDQDGFLTEYVNGDIGKFLLAVSLQITAKGQPVIYYGEELGQSGKNSWDVQDGITYSFGENRDSMPWDKYENRDPVALKIHDHYKKLLQIRGEYSKVFSKGTRTMVFGSNEEELLITKREYNDESIFVGFNISEKEKEATFTVDYPAKTVLTDLYNERNYTVGEDKTITVKIPGNSDGGTIVLVKATEPADNDEGSGSTDNPKEPGTKDESETPGTADDNGKDNSQTGEKTNGDNTLPNTSSNIYSNLLLGMSLLLVSFVFFKRNRKMISK
ncbi:alpha-amylase family glycosyl hydrolase [Bacillus kwashiorkori]|uniref:alpha-amylase family glycosyl hydrolase n=1 Tax=Bacillus kwashiorkori TaxID=1522318 RepID=UPI000781854B|nr:alpha-amylase family glycosyl hydrolase [Bacillus kwashiorkori]